MKNLCTTFFRLVVRELSTHMIKIANKTVVVLKQSTLNRFDWLFYSREFLFLDKQPEKHSSENHRNRLSHCSSAGFQS